MKTIRLIFPYLKPYRGKLLLATALTALATVCDLLLPTIMSDILDVGIHSADMNFIFLCCAKMLAVAAMSLAAVLGGCWLSSAVVAGFCADLRQSVFAKVNTMSIEAVSRFGTAALLSRSTHDIGTLSWVTSMLSGSVVMIPVLFIGGVVLAMGIDVMLSLVLLVFLPLVFLVVIRIGNKIEPLWKISDKYTDKQNDIVRERLHGIRVIRAFNSEMREHARIEEATHTMAKNIIRANVSMGLISPLAMAIMNLAAVVVIWLGGLRMELNPGSVSGGEIFALIQYLGLIMNGVISASYAITMFPHAKVAAGRIGEVLNEESIFEPESAQPVILSGAISMKDVSFCYPGADEAAVSGISLEIKPGQNVAIIGGTGSGKSTIVQLLMGFCRPSAGKILFDGRELDALGGRTVRQNISCVLQKAAIYSGSIRKNLLIGKPDADDAQLRQALRDAQLSEFVEGLPEGLDHELRQSGKNLSGGQKQRLCIARALLKAAPIFIFDDSFSALDFLTEAKLRKALESCAAGKTRIVITQRVSTAMNCDRIFVMDRGRLIAAGDHRQLLEECSVYREIYTSQTGGEAI